MHRAGQGSIVLEQLLYTLSPSVRMWVKERKPQTALEAGHDYSEARKQTAKENRPVKDPRLPSSSVKPTQEQAGKVESDKTSPKEKCYFKQGY